MKLIKWLFWLVLFLVVVAVGGAIFLVTTVDPNKFKPQISQKVESLTGRKLVLAGDIAWQFYPWVGVTLNDFSLSNRSGFTPENMLEAAQVDVQLKVVPLISKQLEIGKITLQSPKINLSVDAQGVTNWDDLSGDGTASAPVADKPEQAAGAMLGGLVVQGVDISHGEISWNDQAAGQQYQLSDFNITTGSIEPGVPVAFDMNSGVSGTDLPADAQLQLKGALLLNDAMDAVTLNDLSTQFSMEDTQAKLALATLNFSVASGVLDVDTLSAEVSMDELSAAVEATALSFALESQQASINKLGLSGQYDVYPFNGELQEVAFDINTNTLTLAGHALSSEYNGVPVVLSGPQLRLNLNEEALEAPELTVKLDDASLNLSVQASQIMGDVMARGHLVSNTFNPGELATKMGIEALAGMPEQAMQSLALEADFSGGLSSVALENLNLKLDKSTLSGGLSIKDFEQPAYRFKLNLDQINVDDYVGDESPAAKQKSAKQASTSESSVIVGSADPAPATVSGNASSGPAAVVASLPYAELKGLDIQGEISIGELRMQDLLSNDVLVTVNTESDQIKISPLQARVYGGETKNTVVYDVSGDIPSVAVSSELISLNMGSFLQAMDITDRFEGFGSVTAGLTTSGLLVDETISNLNGDIKIRLNDGAVRGVDLQASLIKAEALVKQLSGQELGLSADLGDKTEFSEFGSDIQIQQGVMHVSNVNLKAPAIRVAGGGTVDLNTEQLDLRLDVSVVGSFEGQGGASLDKLKGQTIPMKITGSLDSPSILPDLNKLLKKELEREITKKYLGEGESGESFNDALNRKLNEELTKQEQKGTTAGAATEGAPEAADSAPAPVEAEENLTDKQKLRKELKQEGAKLLKGLFGS